MAGSPPVSRILVTGAGGFIGRPTVALLAGRGHDVHGVTSTGGGRAPDVTWHGADLLEDSVAAERVVHEVRPEVLLHLAWTTTPGRFWDTWDNVRWVETSLRLLRAFIQGGGRRAVLVGTGAEYRWDGSPCEEYVTPLEPKSLYAASKAGLHQVAAALAARGGTELLWARVFFPYGPGDHPERLVGSVALALLRGQRARTTEGAQRRDFIFVDDVAGALTAAVESNVTGPVNIASGEAHSVREVTEKVATELDRPEALQAGALASAAEEPSLVIARVARLREEVGYSPPTRLADGLRATVSWWRDQEGGACQVE